MPLGRFKFAYVHLRRVQVQDQTAPTSVHSANHYRKNNSKKSYQVPSLILPRSPTLVWANPFPGSQEKDGKALFIYTTGMERFLVLPLQRWVPPPMLPHFTCLERETWFDFLVFYLPANNIPPDKKWLQLHYWDSPFLYLSSSSPPSPVFTIAKISLCVSFHWSSISLGLFFVY